MIWMQGCFAETAIAAPHNIAHIKKAYGWNRCGNIKARTLMMKQLFANVLNYRRKRAAYHRTVAALSALDIDARLDLAIYRGDISSIAYAAVYK